MSCVLPVLGRAAAAPRALTFFLPLPVVCVIDALFWQGVLARFFRFSLIFLCAVLSFLTGVLS
jgi:hypothetical protein